jgi:phosphate transport system substrate-binding protein
MAQRGNREARNEAPGVRLTQLKTIMRKNCSLLLVSLLAALAAAGADRPITLLSAGSTFIYPILGRWCTEYRKEHPEVQISYDPVGSTHGIARTLAGTADFGASDAPLSDAQIQHAQKRVVHVPVVLGAVVPSYNLPGVTQPLRFTSVALAGIYLGTITRWNDPELVRANPGAQLPAHDLTVVFRTDGSGTTFIWTDYLSKVSDNWRKRVGRGASVAFPVGVGGQFNEGVRDLIKEKPYAIGYLQITYAVQGRIQAGLVQNSTGNFVKADSAGITAAAAATATDMPEDFRASITNAADSKAYPISSFTWLLVPEHIADQTKRQAITGFLRWVLTDGQRFAAPLNYAPLPGDVASRVVKVVDRIQ